MSLLKRANSGFTLAELLISLAILGVIATFTIPKILSSSTNGQNTAVAKEAASMISGAYSAYTLTNGASASTTGGALTSSFNYVSVDNATAYAAGAAGSTVLQTCSAALPCLKLHNGAILQYDTAQTFGSTVSPSAIYFNLDPDANGTQGRISFVQYANGRLTTGSNATPAPTQGVAGTITMQATDPAYLSNWN